MTNAMMTLSGLSNVGHRGLTLSWFEVSKQAVAEASWDLMQSQLLQTTLKLQKGDELFNKPNENSVLQFEI